MRAAELRRLLPHARGAHGIARRYFVTNGFDGAFTMLGLMVGFYLGGGEAPGVALQASLGAAVALAMSGLSSAYLSESAERKRELLELEQALITDLDDSDVGRASRLVPVVVAAVNGLAPLLLSLLIMTPLWLAQHGLALPLSPFLLAALLALLLMFLLGVVLARLSRESWLWSGLRALAIGGGTVLIILAVSF
jgi:predicted membrane protein (TIGR00267 family)